MSKLLPCFNSMALTINFQFLDVEGYITLSGRVLLVGIYIHYMCVYLFTVQLPG